MKITLLTAYISRNAGGLLPAIKDLFHAYIIQNEKDEIVLFSNKDEYTDIDINQWKPIDTYVLPNKLGKFLYSPSLRKNINSNYTDILHLHGIWQYPQIVAYKWKKQHPNKKLIVTTHGMLDINLLKMRSKIKNVIGMFLFHKKVFNTVDCYHALNKSEVTAIRKFGINTPIAVIPNGVSIPNDTTPIIPKDNKKHLLYLGRIHPKKGLDILLQAIACLVKEGGFNNWILDVVGWGQLGFDKKMEDLACSLNISDYVCFHGGKFGDEKLNMFRTCDVYILPSLSEGLPMTVLEAWACKKPVIMTEECNLPEGFEYNAAIKIQTTTESIVQEFKFYNDLTGKEKRNLGNNGYELVQSLFTWDKVAEKMRLLYLWTLGKIERLDFVYLK